MNCRANNMYFTMFASISSYFADYQVLSLLCCALASSLPTVVPGSFQVSACRAHVTSTFRKARGQMTSLGGKTAALAYKSLCQARQTLVMCYINRKKGLVIKTSIKPASCF